MTVHIHCFTESRGIMTSTPATSSEYEYEYDYQTPTPTVAPATCQDAKCVFLAVINVIIFILGVTGNSLVIWIAGFKMKKSVNTTWYLSLAVSDFLFCSFLPFSVVHTVKEEWVLGHFMCKFTSFIMFLNMFSSIFLLVVISVDRCVVVLFPVWAQNKRTVSKAHVIVVLAWIIAAAFSSPPIIFREVGFHRGKKVCFNHYTSHQDTVAIVACRFVFGFVIPFLVIVLCYAVIIRKLKLNQSPRSRKPFKIMTALIAAFLICWLPFHTVAWMELNSRKYAACIPTGQAIATTVASGNSCLNPFLYAFMGKDFKRKCSALLSKIENAIEEEGRSTARGTSFTTSGERRFSTAV